jgi:hypothetical protein
MFKSQHFHLQPRQQQTYTRATLSLYLPYKTKASERTSNRNEPEKKHSSSSKPLDQSASKNKAFQPASRSTTYQAAYSSNQLQSNAAFSSNRSLYQATMGNHPHIITSNPTLHHCITSSLLYISSPTMRGESLTQTVGIHSSY